MKGKISSVLSALALVLALAFAPLTVVWAQPGSELAGVDSFDVLDDSDSDEEGSVLDLDDSDSEDVDSEDVDSEDTDSEDSDGEDIDSEDSDGDLDDTDSEGDSEEDDDVTVT